MSSNNCRSILLIGASVRAVAVSALRAGLLPWCADLFADADLQRIAVVHHIYGRKYTDGLLAALDEAPPGPVMYTGALENRPELIARIHRPLWGNNANVLRGVRSPRRWMECLRANGLACPQWLDTPPCRGRWLLKPIRSAAGTGIGEYTGQVFRPSTHFLQQWIDGVPCSAIFVASGDRAVLLGSTRQLIGTSWLNASDFHYAGSAGPLPLDDATASHWRKLGNVLAKEFQLRGLFGIDAILRDGVPWPVEINPRYTASLEILERSYRTSLLSLHRQVFENQAFQPFEMPPPTTSWAKGILYARDTLTFPTAGPWREALQDNADLNAVEFADIPHPGAIIQRDRPVLTLFASASSLAACEEKLREKAHALARRLWQ